MIDVFFGESHVAITDELRQELGWDHGVPLDVSCVCDQTGKPAGKWRVRWETPLRANDPRPRLWIRGSRWYFKLAIPGVVRGRLNGARGVEGKVEGDALVIDVRNLLAPSNS